MLVFFGVVTAYSFIIGRNQTLKVITATYVAVLCADGIGNMFSKYLASSVGFIKVMKFFSIANSDQSIAFVKVLFLIVFIVIIAVRGMFNYDTDDNRPLTVRVILVLMLGVLSGGLMISAMLIFVSGNSLVASSVAGYGALANVYQQSRLVKIMLDYANLWFFLPGLALIGFSVFGRKR